MFVLNIDECKHCEIMFLTADFELSEAETCRATIRMFVDFNLVGQFHIPYDVSFCVKHLLYCE